MLTAILNERRIEFGGEGLRWADIQRLGKDPLCPNGQIPAKIATTDMKADGSGYNLITRPGTPTAISAVPYDDHRFIWPIPNSEIILNTVLAGQQNPDIKFPML